MKMFCQVVILSAILVAAKAASSSKHSLTELCESESQRKEYVNEVMDKLRTILKTNEPFKMEDDIRQVMRLYDGQLYGMHNFYLRDTPQVACADGKASMHLLFSFNQTKAHYTWNFAGLKQLTGGFWTFAKRITTEVALSAPLNFGKAVPFTVDTVKVTELDGLNVRVDGVQPFAWIASQIGNIGTSISRGTLKTFLQSNLKTIFSEVFNQYEV